MIKPLDVTDRKAVEALGQQMAEAGGTGEGGFYKPGADILQPEDIAEAIRWAVTQPARVSVNEVLVRPFIHEL